MEVGGPRWASVGGVHRAPLRNVDGALYLCGLDAVGPSPADLLEHVDAHTVVCLQSDLEIERRYPGYLRWLAAPEPHESLRLPTGDRVAAEDEPVISLVAGVLDRVRGGEGVVIHCGAGWGRTGVIAALVMVAAGASIDEALQELRLARPGAGPQSVEQELQISRVAPAVSDRFALD